jgi:superfamily II DNA or RNA helicase
VRSNAANQPSQFELLLRVLRSHPDVRFTPAEVAAIALARAGRTSMSEAQLRRALGELGFDANTRWRLEGFAEPGAIRAREGGISVAEGTTPDRLVAALIARIKRPPPPRIPPPRTPVAQTPPRRPPQRKDAPVGASKESRAHRAAKAAATTSAAPPPPPAIPGPPQMIVAPPRWEPIEAAAVARVLASPANSPAVLAHALDAHALAAADQFEDLLSMSLLRGVDAQVYQLETVRRVLRQFRGRALLADEVGLGKTIEAIMVLREYQLRGMVRRALVLVPAALVGQWAGELREKAGIEAIVAGESDAASDAWVQDGVVLASQALARQPRHASVLAEVQWDLVIVDEAHRVKRRSTQGWKLVDGLKSRFLLMLTATPVETDLEELYNLVTLLKPGQLATLAEFRRQFVDPKDPTHARQVDRLRGLLAEVMVRNTRANSGLSLPPRFVTTVATEPSAAERALYDAVVALMRRHRARPEARRLADALLLEAGSSARAVRATLARARGSEHDAALAADLVDVERLADVARESAKAEALLGILRAHREKVLVFTRFRETLLQVQALAEQARVGCAVVHGGIDRKRKEEAFRRFHEDLPLLVCTDVGSEGHNLQHCHVLVNFDLPWNPMVIEQRIGRLHRYGQAEPVRVYNLCAKGTAEERLLDVLDRRVHLFELVVGEMDMILGNLVEQQDLEARVLSLYADSQEDAQLAEGFEALASDLARARGQYDGVRALDHALFGKEFEA